MSRYDTTRNACVLLVEDNDIDVELVDREFKRQAITSPLYHADCGVEALEMLRGQNQKSPLLQPCVMLIDINMPKMDGFEFLQEVRKDKNLQQSIAFMLTTSARDTDVSRAYALNVAGYFLKDDTRKMISMLSFYLQCNQFPEDDAFENAIRCVA